MAEQRVFRASGIELDEMASALEQWFINKGFDAQTVEQGQKRVVQARKGDEGWSDWRSWLGVSAALHVTLDRQGDDLIVGTDAAKWIDKVGVGLAGAFIMPIFLVPAAYGTYQQAKLPSDVFAFVTQYVSSRGPVATPWAKAPASAKVACASCGGMVNAGSKFCEHCGQRIPEPQPKPEAQNVFCGECGAELSPGSRFCSSCGTRVGEKA
jgi:hypothetical protein